MKDIARFAIFGAVGFGIGGFFSALTTLLGVAITFQQTQIWPNAVIAWAVWGFGFAVKGAIGGTALGLTLRGGRRMTRTLALFGAIGFLVGGSLFLPFLRPVRAVPGGMLPWLPLGIVLLALAGTALVLAVRKGRMIIAASALFGAIGFLAGGSLVEFPGSRGMFPAVGPGIGFLEGALGGAVLGLALRDRRKTVGLAFAGALGFGIGLLIASYLQHWLDLGPLLRSIIMLSLEGITGGAVLGAVLGYLEKRKVMHDTRVD